MQVYHGIQEESSDAILAMAGNPGAITIATNMAVRGADIVTTPEVERNGGLHVMVTFGCSNFRVERQGFGRTGRQGNKGTYHYILKASTFSLNNHQSGEIEDEALVSTWREGRDGENPLREALNLYKSHLVHLKYIATEIFLILPENVRKQHSTAWIKLYGALEKTLRKAALSYENIGDVSEKAFKLFEDFWQTSELASVHSQEDMYRYLGDKNHHLMEKITKYFPEILQARHADKRCKIN